MNAYVAAASFSSPSADARCIPVANGILRCGAALCFIGHGAFGFITKEAWLPYFAVTGIAEPWAWRLMPWIGALDVLAGMAVLFAPRRLPLLYMVAWALWTALLRPLAGEPMFETIERAGNYGVPLAFLLLAGWPRRWTTHAVVAPLPGPRSDAVTLRRVREVLKWTTCLLLVGHGALGATSGKPMLTAHYSAIGLPPATTAFVGWFELGLAAIVALRPSVALLLFVTCWKLGTESLFFAAGDPIWEFVERAGSFAAPLALAVLLSADRPARAVKFSPRVPRRQRVHSR